MIVIGISGKKGVGKNYVSEKYIVPILIKKYREIYPTKIICPFFISFATCLKSELYGRNESLTFEDLMIREKSAKLRNLLQEYGTKMGREEYNKDIWVRQVYFWMMNHKHALESIGNSYIPMFVIQDIRFKNELDFVSGFQNALIIRVISEERHIQRCFQENQNMADMHISETELDFSKFPYYIYNDDKHEPLFRQSLKIITEFMLLRLHLNQSRTHRPPNDHESIA